MIIITFLLVVCVINIEAAVEGDSCIKKGYPGVCTAIKQCPDALLDIENRVQPQICGFGFTTLVVCCISSGQTATQSATTTAAPAISTDKPQKGNCILPPYPNHGSYVASVPNGKPGDAFDVFIITVSCRRGYEVQGSRTVVCQDGSWPEPMPRCLRACYLEAHPSVEYTCMATEGGTNVSRICRELEFHGVIASPRCRGPHYKSTTALKLMNCIRGSWDSLATCEPECGIVIPTAQYHKKPTERSDAPWYAGIYQKTKTPYEHICGGSLISPKVVLTAASCVWNDFIDELPKGSRPASDFTVAVGKLYQSWEALEDKDYVQYTDVKEIQKPSEFHGHDLHYHSDVAILIVSSPFELRPQVIWPVCLDYDTSLEEEQLTFGNYGLLAGWNFSDKNGTKFPGLQITVMTYMDPRNGCMNNDFKSGYSEICAEVLSERGKVPSRYSSDKGGGLVYGKTTSSYVKRYLRGILSSNSVCWTICNTWFTFMRVLAPLAVEYLIVTTKRVLRHRYLIVCMKSS